MNEDTKPYTILILPDCIKQILNVNLVLNATDLEDAALLLSYVVYTFYHPGPLALAIIGWKDVNIPKFSAEKESKNPVGDLNETLNDLNALYKKFCNMELVTNHNKYSLLVQIMLSAMEKIALTITKELWKRT